MTTEQDVVDQLSDWLFDWGFEVYQNHTNKKYRCFSVSGESKRKPDLFITHKELGDYWNCIIEVKKGDCGMGEVIGGVKIIDYYFNYCENKTKYYITGNNCPLTPTNFLLATKYSPDGRLFKVDINEEPINPDGWRPIGIEYGMLPKKEFSKTYTLIRTVYKMWKPERRKEGVNLGILLSDVLDGGVGRPAIQGQIKKTKSWRQCWRVVR